MHTVSALVAELDVTEASLQGPSEEPPSAVPALTVSGPYNATRGGTGKAPAADKAGITVYSRDGKPSAAAATSDEQLKSRLAAGKKAAGANNGNAAAAEEAAEGGHAEDHSPSNSRPARQRGKAQPYWMGGAVPASSPAPREPQASPAESDAVLGHQQDKPQPADAQQPKGNGAKAGKTGKAKQAPTMAKRQTRTSPHKEQHQQQPAKRLRTVSKRQQDEEQLHHEAAMEDAAEAAMVGAVAADADQVAEQPAKAADETGQAGGTGTAHTEDSKCATVQKLGTGEDGDLAHQQDAVSQTAAVAPNRSVVIVCKCCPFCWHRADKSCLRV